MTLPQCLIDTVSITRTTNVDKNKLYVLGYLMQEVGEFVEAVDAFTNPNSIYDIEHDEHIFDEAADVIQNVFSHAAMFMDGTTISVVNAILIPIPVLEQETNSKRVALTIPGMSPAIATNMLTMSVGNYAEASMIQMGLIAHKKFLSNTAAIHGATVVNNVFGVVKACYPHLTNDVIQEKILGWIDKKNKKWLSVTSATAE